MNVPSTSQDCADASKVVPGVPECVVLNDKLCGYGGPEAQRERRCLVQLVIRERAHRVSRLATVLPQEFERGGLRYPLLLLCMLGIYLRDNLPRDVRNGLAAGDGSGSIDLNRVHVANVMHDDADPTAICLGHRCAPLRF